MKVELFPFQKNAVCELRTRTAAALGMYHNTHIPQVISLQAPTGAGKTIIMAALIEDIYFGTENYADQPEAIFVWLSDSPALNEQSKQKIDLKADRIKFGQCVVIEDDSFDMEELQDGHIYFLNTQKLGKAGNLGKHSDNRQYTIWETLENTAKTKAGRLYFIIDEAHRGMQGTAAGMATSIMQRFIKGSAPHKLSPMPVVIGMSATSARFNRLVGDTNSTLQRVIITPNDVRASGLLKDRILITYPDDPEKHNDMAVLQAAADEWKSKCDHWHQYCYEQHYAHVNPIFVIQVQAGTGKSISNTNLDDVISKIEERTGVTFKENEIVHTFGSAAALLVNGLKVPHVEPSEITDDRRIKIVLFKENLSTGWDCPRAETMMSFRHAEDATYIAQLLGRMVRTPLQSHILVDDYLNDVRLYLPYFNAHTVEDVVKELQNSEGEDIPTVVDSESLEEVVYVPWTIHTTQHRKENTSIPGQVGLEDFLSDKLVLNQGEIGCDCQQINLSEDAEGQEQGTKSNDFPLLKQPCPQREPCPIISVPVHVNPTSEEQIVVGEQLSFLPEIDREGITKFINDQGLLTYVVKTAKIHSYLKSLLDLAGLLTYNMIYQGARDEIEQDILDMMREYIDDLHQSGEYEPLSARVLEFKLLVDVFDVFGQSIKNYGQMNFTAVSDSDIDRQLRAADARIGNYGFCNLYGRRYLDIMDVNAYKIDCILFAADDNCIANLNKYAEKKFHELNDKYRRYVVGKSEKCRKQYDDIVANSDIVSKHNFTLPETISVKTEPNGKKYDNHLFAYADGIAQIRLNGWESGLIDEESKRSDFICWLRNPPREKWSMCMPYEMEGEIKPTYPDFIIVRKDAVLGYVIDILEPHNPSFKDNLGKAKALAKYAEEEPKIGRVQLIRREKDASGKDKFKRLDMSHGSVRQKVLKAINTDEIDHIFETDGFFE